MTRALGAFAGLVGAVALAACGPRPGPATGADPSPAAAPAPANDDDPVITLERTPCFGSCPVYQVSIARSGLIRWEGKNHVAQPGPASAQIPSERVDSLVNELRAGGYFDFAERYVLDAPACGQYATDSPTVITSVTLEGGSKRIQHDYGCSGAPPELGRLERRIDEVAGVARWTGR
ncbi:MAG: DUF6438 domain-containing protein [Gemmatimonadales bacterium]